MADNDARAWIYLTQDTVLKRGTGQSSQMNPSDLYPVKADTSYPVAAWKEEKGHWKFTLYYSQLGGFNTWYAFKGHSQIVFAKPEVNTGPSKPQTITGQIKVPGITRPVLLNQPIYQGSSFTWAEATHGGTRVPETVSITYGIIRIARAAQVARDRIGRPFVITSWYRPPAINSAVGGAIYSRHLEGDALDFYIDGMTGQEIYNALDHWWEGGLGKYRSFPALSHIDARGHWARWEH